jgi:hypothetical protein
METAKYANHANDGGENAVDRISRPEYCCRRESDWATKLLARLELGQHCVTQGQRLK